MRTFLTPLEASFFEWEDAAPSDHMHIGWAMVFDPLPAGGVPTFEEVRLYLVGRLVHLPKFKLRFVPSLVPALLRPTWKTDPEFRVAAHLEEAELPPPGGEEELLDWLGEFYSRRLTRSRPLWQLAVVTGLAEGGWALAIKVHHALLDGIGSAAATEILFATEGAEVSSSRTRWSGRASGRTRSPSTGLRELLVGVGAARRTMVNGDHQPVPTTSLNVPIGSQRRLRYVEIPVERLWRITEQLGGTLNDAVLAATAGGLRHLFERRGDTPLPAYIRTMVPVNARAPGDRDVDRVRVSSLYLELPIAEPDALNRYRMVVGASTRAKCGGHAARLGMLLAFARVLPPFVQAALGQKLFPPSRHRLTVTNLPGPETTLHALGARMRRILPVMQIGSGRALGVAAVSYADTMIVGLIADRFAVPDLQVLEVGIAASIEELSAVADATALKRFKPPSGATSSTDPAAPSGLEPEAA